MIEIVKKTFMAGAGFAHKTWDEVEVLANEVVKKAKMGEKESAKFLKDLKKRYDGTQNKLEKYVEKVVKDILKKMDIATGADIKALQKEIRLLKKANSSASPRKQPRSTTAKKSTAGGAKKRNAATATKKRTTAGVKKSTTTGAKKRAGTASAKKRTVRATKK
jgi:polyhydroxyalkanoate synthesis regulator phasin